MRLLPLACLGALAACAPAISADRHYDVASFDRVRTEVPFNVRVHTGGRPGVAASGDREAIDRLEVGVSNGELVVSMKPGGWLSGWGGRHHLVIDVTAPSIRAATLNGPGDLDVDAIRGREAALLLRGPGNIRVGTIEAGMLRATLQGPGNIEARGRAARVTVVADGPGDVRFGGLAARDIDVTLNGPGDVDAVATGTARLVLHGPGDINVGGHPRCTIEKHGPGDIRCG